MQSVLFTDAEKTIAVRARDGLQPLFSAALAPPRRSAWKELLLGPDAYPPRLSLPRIAQGLTVQDGALYVCDPGLPDIVRIDLATGRARRWTSPSARPACPVAIAFDERGRAYVADATLGALLEYDSSGNLVRQLRPPSDGDDGALHPSAVLADGDLVYVANALHRRVERYRISQGTWLAPIERSSDPFLAPAGLARAPDGDLLVADALAGVVHRVNPEGEPRAPLGSRGRGPGQFVRPLHVACTSDGVIFVVDAARQSVQAFRENGSYLLEVAAENSWPGFVLPMGAAVFARNPLPSEPLDGLVPRPMEQWLIVSDALADAPLKVLAISAYGHRDVGEESAGQRTAERRRRK